MRHYDRWKTRSPFDDAPPECPQCGDGHLESDPRFESVDCDNPDCDYGYEPDWDRIAEERAERRGMDW